MLMIHSLRFFTALTLVPSDIRKIHGLVQDYGIKSKPLSNILITPLFIQRESIEQVRKLRETEGSTIMFDSGGYYVQIGKINYEELYYPLLSFYRDNQWADIYTIPDYVPTSQDNEELVWMKVQQTARTARIFYREMPPSIRERAMPVVQGHTYEQVDHCLKIYCELGVQHIGFGSFGTLGKKNEINVTTSKTTELAGYVADFAHQRNIRVHFFGIGVPALVAMIYGLKATSFDSSSWIKSAGFGQIFFPFMRSYNISHRNRGSELQRGITVEEFERLKSATRHNCPFCQSVDELQRKKLFRALHNLVVIHESVDMINSMKLDTIQMIYENGSAKYQKEYEKWLSKQ